MSRGTENRAGSAGGHRIQRVEREIREVIGVYLLSGFRGELHGIVSVSRVIVSKDLRQAKVFVTVMGSETDRKSSVSELQAQAYDIQSHVNHRLRMKYCPRLTFLYDEGFDHVLKVEKILHDLGEERKRRESTAGDSVAGKDVSKDKDESQDKGEN